MEREIKKGSTPLAFEQLGLEITATMKSHPRKAGAGVILSVAYRDYKQYVEKTIMNNVYGFERKKL